ncbi:hypothetical protein V5O48_018254 [Marasmius crinis-equi]|uniref:Cytochrome b561 domain-containing protein n=1 Tax=Marasmius crinis-equi TaxID=585013 RepID=A0ABR3ELP5_9AGAR
MKVYSWSRPLLLCLGVIVQIVTSTPHSGGNGSSDSDTSVSGNGTSLAVIASACFKPMCITGSLNGTDVQYELSARETKAPGWMAIGFGSKMDSNSMAIFWTNSDGSITMSQRTGSGHDTPLVESNPARPTTLVDNLSSATGSVKYAFTIPFDGNTFPHLIWAYGSKNPGSSRFDADFEEHDDEGTVRLNLAGIATKDIPLASYEKLFIGHAILCVIGFLVLLPAGALLARYYRTFTNAWFRAHWIVQATGGTIIIVGVALGMQGVTDLGSVHFGGVHKALGIAVFVFYFLQCGLGLFIHKIKLGKPGRRPPQNYVHAVFGILIVGLSVAQVRTGYITEWPTVSGRGPVSNGANVIWYIWTALLPLLYLGGLAFLPKQFKQEAAYRAAKADEA